MAYNLYQVQQSNAWTQRIEKENATAQRFQGQANLSIPEQSIPFFPAVARDYAFPSGPADLYFPSSGRVEATYVLAPEGSTAGAPSRYARSVAPSGATTKTGALRSKIDKLEAELNAERDSRRKAEVDLTDLKISMLRR